MADRKRHHIWSNVVKKKQSANDRKLCIFAAFKICFDCRILAAKFLLLLLDSKIVISIQFEIFLDANTRLTIKDY
jgi:hypothetical protein